MVLLKPYDSIYNKQKGQDFLDKQRSVVMSDDSIATIKKNSKFR